MKHRRLRASLTLVAALTAGCAGGGTKVAPLPGAGIPAVSPRDTLPARHVHARRDSARHVRHVVAPLPAGHPGDHLLHLAPGTSVATVTGAPPAPGAPRAAGGAIRWSPPLADGAVRGIPAGALRRDRDSSLVVDSLALWPLRAADPELREPALLRWAGVLLTAGDTLRADSVLATPGLDASVWAWDALKLRVRLAAARGDTLGADTLLRRASLRGWPDPDLAGQTLAAARAALARGDTARALRQATDCVERFPALAPASGALQILDTLTAARGESLRVPLAREAAEVEAFRGDAAAAVARLEDLLPRTAPGERTGIGLRIGEFWRRARRWSDATRALERALPGAPDSKAAARVRLEMARVLRDAGRSDAALAMYAKADRMVPAAALQEVIRWERAREFQDLGRFGAAERAFAATAAVRGRRADEARYLAGLMAFLDGRPRVALERWDGNGLEAARFWRGVLLRRKGDARGDSLLRTVAVPPGYGFYAAAARETLGVRGAPAETVPAAPEPDSGSAPRVLALVRAGMVDEAMALAGRRAARDARLGSTPVSPGEALACAEAAQMSDRPSRVVAFAQWALRAADGQPDSVQWAILPWAFPPAWDSLVVAESDSLGLEPALLFATMRQESVFDPAARSSSNALGLMQLLRPAAQDAARWGGEPKPASEAPLLDPATNLKWGARYLARQIARFDGRVTVGLSAYNAGPSTVPEFWRDLIGRGGEALFCEVASNADAQLYAKRIVGYRAAYRELDPTVAP